MKKFVMIPALTLLLFLLGYTLASAQDYVVTIKGDTLNGKVRYFNSSGSGHSGSKYIQLTPPTGKKSSYQMLEAKAFKMNNEIYHTVRLANGYTIMKLISEGYLNLYGYQIENQTSWDGRYFVKKDGALLDVPNMGFKKRVSQFLADCPDVVNKIESGELNRIDLTKVAAEYNACKRLNSVQEATKSPVAEQWGTLLTAVEGLPEFDKKTDALEMIREIKSKVAKNEAIPSFLINGLKDSLKNQPSVTEKLDQALQTLNK